MTQPNEQLRDIRDFHRKFEQLYDGPPRLLEGELAQFRIKFLLEEVKELAEIFGIEVRVALSSTIEPMPATVETMANALDALVDLDYVLKGTAHLMGLDATFMPAWRNVHRANMAKELARDAGKSLRGYALDVIKPPGWSAPDHRPLLQQLVNPRPLRGEPPKPPPGELPESVV